MKKPLITLSLLFAIQPACADVYPGDAIFSTIVQRVYHEVSSDQIAMAYKTSITNRNDLCDLLVYRHNNHVSPGAGQTNAAFIGFTLTKSECLNALTYSTGYNSSAGWAAWAGILSGTWFNDSPALQFNDAADWMSPVQISGIDNRIYDLQNVVFTQRSGNARYGWNMSHPNVAYVWGWDAKDNVNLGLDNGEVGTHVGWAFEKQVASGTSHCIVWATPKEAFLECVIPRCAGGKRRVSTGFFGTGQWRIGLTCRVGSVKGLSNELCNLGFHSAPSGTRSSPNITWKLCSAGFQ